VARISPNEYLVDVFGAALPSVGALKPFQEIARQASYRVCFLAHAGTATCTLTCCATSPFQGSRRRVLKAGGEILKLCAGMGGSIGGEHGIGLEKPQLPAADVFAGGDPGNAGGQGAV